MKPQSLGWTIVPADTVKTLQEFRQYQLSETADGRSIELARSEEEVVCLAFDTSRQFFVAMHVLAEDFEEREEEEAAFHARAALAKEIRHPNVAVVYEAGEDEGTPYFVTEYVGGELVEEYFERVGAVPEVVALQVISQLARGLGALTATPELLQRVDARAARVAAYSAGLGDLVVKLSDPGVAATGVMGGGGAEERHCEVLAGLLLAGMGAASVRDIASLRVREVLETSGLGGTVRRFLTAVADGEVRTLEAFARGVDRCIDDGFSSGEHEIEAPVLPVNPIEGQLRSAASIERVLGEAFELAYDVAGHGAVSGWPVASEADGGRYRVFQLPPERLCAAQLTTRVERAAGREGSGRMREIAACWRDPGGDLYAETDEVSEPLDRYMKRQAGLSGDEVVWVGWELHRALDEANEEGFDIWGFGTRGVVLTGMDGGRLLAAGSRPVLQMRGYPNLEALTEPARFRPDGIGPERSSVAPDDYAAFLCLMRELEVRDSNPLLESALNLLFTRESENEVAGVSASERRVRFLEDFSIFFEENGLRDDFEGEGAFDDAEGVAAIDAEHEASDSPPGVAQALFRSEEPEEVEGWNPIARSVAGVGDEDELLDEEMERGGGGWIWLVLLFLVMAGATIGVLAYFFGWELW